MQSVSTFVHRNVDENSVIHGSADLFISGQISRLHLNSPNSDLIKSRVSHDSKKRVPKKAFEYV